MPAVWLRRAAKLHEKAIGPRDLKRLEQDKLIVNEALKAEAQKKAEIQRKGEGCWKADRASITQGLGDSGSRCGVSTRF